MASAKPLRSWQAVLVPETITRFVPALRCLCSCSPVWESCLQNARVGSFIAFFGCPYPVPLRRLVSKHGRFKRVYGCTKHFLSLQRFFFKSGKSL